MSTSNKRLEEANEPQDYETSKMEDSRFHKVHDTVIMLLCTGKYSSLGDKTQQFYVAWSELDPEQKVQFDGYICLYVPAEYLQIYRALMSAYGLWDDTQTQFGAPGGDHSREGPYDDPQLEMELINVLTSIQSVWRKFSREVPNRRRIAN